MKILIIGQAPPAIKQKYPYDSTLLYNMLGWVGISIESAQELFEFEAISNEFPGFDNNGGHKAPTKEQCDRHWNKTLKGKVIEADKIILLGKVASKYFNLIPKTCSAKVLELPHPSRRNFNLIKNSQLDITTKLAQFIK